MVKLELDQVVMRRMKEDDIEMVKALIKVCITYTDKVMDTVLSSRLIRKMTCVLVMFGLNFIFNLCHFLARRAARAQKTASFSISSLVHSVFSSWLFSLQSCVALSTPLSWLLLYLSSC